MRVTRKRSLLKTVSWRAIATAVTVILVYLFTGKIHISLGVGGLELVSKIILYYLHERVWDRINYGRIMEVKQPTEAKGQ